MPFTHDSLGKKALGIEVVPPLDPADASRLARILSGQEPGFSAVIKHMIIASNGPDSTSFIASNPGGRLETPDAISLGVAMENLLSPAHAENIRVVNGAAQSVPGAWR